MLYILTGLPYAGKTTMRNRIMEEVDMEVISIDSIMDQENMWREGHPTQTDWENAYAKAYDTLQLLLVAGKQVLFDGGCLKFNERETLRNIALEAGSSAQVLYVKVSREEIIQRRKNNGITKERGQLDEATLENAFAMFEEPIAAENPIIYDGDIKLEKWVDEVFLKEIYKK
jgi:predicted kinase